MIVLGVLQIYIVVSVRFKTDYSKGFGLDGDVIESVILCLHIHTVFEV